MYTSMGSQSGLKFLILLVVGIAIVSARNVSFVALDASMSRHGVETPLDAMTLEHGLRHTAQIDTTSLVSVKEIASTPRRALTRGAFELVFGQRADALGFLQNYSHGETILMEANATIRLKNVHLVEEQTYVDGVWVLGIVLFLVVVSLACTAISAWMYSVVAKHQRSTAAERRLAEKFGQIYKRHIGAAK